MGSGGITSLLDICGRALSAQSQAIRVVGNNIANVNTKGYSRRDVDFVSVNSGSLASNYGEGVDINSVNRTVDKFLNIELQRRVNDSAGSAAKEEMLGRLESVFTVSGETNTIGSELSKFFSSLEDLKADPANLPLRSNVLEAGQSLAASVRAAYNQAADLQREADNRLATGVLELNSLTQQIADLNMQISGAEASGQEQLGFRDSREELLRQLSEKVSFQQIENSDGTVNVSLDNGFGLVIGGTSRALDFVQTPSFGPGVTFPPGLDGGPLGFVVYDYDPTAGSEAHVDLTAIVAAGGGELAGLVGFRGVQSATDLTPFDARGDVVDVASRVEAVAQDLLTRFNLAYLGPDEDGTTPAVLEPSARGLNNFVPSTFGLFTVPGAADNGDGTPALADLAGFSSLADKLQFGVSRPEDFAAALDLDPAAGSVVTAPGDGSNIDRLLLRRDTATAYSVGNFTGTSTIEDLYSQTVTVMGSMKSKATSDVRLFQDRETQVREYQSSMSGVSIDEELAKLINYQRGFEASAKLIKIADDLLGQIISLSGR